MRTIAVLLSLAALAAADSVTCKDKRRIEGKIVEDAEDHVKIQVKNGSVTIPRHQIEKVEYGATADEVWQSRHDRVDAKDALALLELAQWCDKSGLKKQAEIEYGRVTETTDPGEPAVDDTRPDAAARHLVHRAHLEAHKALKQVLSDGKWVSYDEYCRARGMVQFDGAWMSPEEAKLKAALKEKQELEKALGEKVRECLRKLASSDIAARDDARDQLDSIPADLKFAPLLENLDSRTAEIRSYCIGALSAYNRPEAMPALVRRALTDDSEALRAAALDALKKINSPDTWQPLQKGLASEYSHVRIRAAWALCEFPNERAAEALLNALVKAAAPKGGFDFSSTETDPRLAGATHMTDDARKALEAAGKVPGKNASGGMDPLVDPEAKARKEQSEKEKAAMVKALEACTGLSYGDNLEMWREWWLQKHAATAAKGGADDKDKGADPAGPPPPK